MYHVNSIGNFPFFIIKTMAMHGNPKFVPAIIAPGFISSGVTAGFKLFKFMLGLLLGLFINLL